MRVWDSVTQGGAMRPWPAALAILMAGLLLSLTPVSLWMESGYYGLLQRWGAPTPSDDIILVDTRELESESPSVWDAHEFPHLLMALGQAGASVVLTIDPPPVSSSLPDAIQLQTLAEIERRTRGNGDDDNAGRAPLDDAFGRELAAIRERSEHQSRTTAAVRRLRNVIISVPTFEGTRAAGPVTAGCPSHKFPAVASAEDVAQARRVGAVVPPPRQLCSEILGAGHAEFWADPDGVVRYVDLLVNASGTLVPSMALRAAAVHGAPDETGSTPAVSTGVISWGSRIVHTGGGPGILLRYYTAESPFARVSGADILRGVVNSSEIAGRIAVVGHIEPGPSDPGYLAPSGHYFTAATGQAIAISNLLQQHYLIRPEWLEWAETLLLIAVGFAVIAWGVQPPPALAVMAGISAGVLLLAAEAWLMLWSGVWAQLATCAAFAVLGMTGIRLVSRETQQARVIPTALAVGSGTPAAIPNRISGEDELDLAFSMLRHQAPSTQVKQRLYDMAIEHARRRDLAKAERVLRHLASIDPDFRHAGEKLQKLAGIRKATPVSAAERPPRPSEPGTDPGTLAGKTIGRYEIEQAIGRGAMATVYLGRDPKINRRVAVKTIALAEEFSDTDLVNARTQFLREAESAGRLNHPNIISIYDAGEDGLVAYLAMEYFPGKALSCYAQQGRLLPAQRVFELMARAAEALHYAHGQHVVHRDVKPANLLYDSASDVLKITDFGIARLTDTSRTKTGIILGTPSYMSPEQLAGTNVTGQSDLFSLGITLYQLLCGMPPFRADSIPRLMQRIAHEPHEPIGNIRDDLPPCADEILNRALAKNPANRFPSGRAMALALRDCCSSFGSRSEDQSS